jgi:hypothetical protein
MYLKAYICCFLFNSLMRAGEDDSAYNKLSPGIDKVLYYRAPSYDSGGHLSEVLKDGNQGQHREGGVEHEEETVQV